MTWRVLAAAAVIALTASCAAEGAAPAVTNELARSGMAATGLFGTTWFVEEIGGTGVRDGVTSLFVLHSAGDVTGSGGCSPFSARVTVDGNAMTFHALATTETVCTPALKQQEQKFFAALAATRSYRTRGPTCSCTTMPERCWSS
jgi:putative lipoprotein